MPFRPSRSKVHQLGGSFRNHRDNAMKADAIGCNRVKSGCYTLASRLSSSPFFHSPLLQSVIAEVRHVNARSINRDTFGAIEFTKAPPRTSERLQGRSAGIKDTDETVAEISAVHPSRRIDAYPRGHSKPERPSKQPPTDNIGRGVSNESLQAVVVCVRNPERAIASERHVRRVVQLAVPNPARSPQPTQELAVGAEHQHVMAIEVRDENRALLVHRDAAWRIEPVDRQMANEGAVQLKNGNAIVVVLCDVQESVWANAEMHRPIQFARPFASPAERPRVLAFGTEDHHAVCPGISDEDLSGLRNRHANRSVELAQTALADSPDISRMRSRRIRGAKVRSPSNECGDQHDQQDDRAKQLRDEAPSSHSLEALTKAEHCDEVVLQRKPIDAANDRNLNGAFDDGALRNPLEARRDVPRESP